jgi:hypothetical protein
MDTGGYPGQFAPAAPGQPEATATVATPMPAPELPDMGGLGEMPLGAEGHDMAPFDVGGLPMPPLPPPPPGTNSPLALPGAEPTVGGRSMMGAPPPGQDLFGGNQGGGDEDLMRRILAGLPRGA